MWRSIETARARGQTEASSGTVKSRNELLDRDNGTAAAPKLSKIHAASGTVQFIFITSRAGRLIYIYVAIG